MAERIISACDGASKGNPGPAGWAWVIAGADGRPERWEAGPLGRATNNVAELTALKELLGAVGPGTPLEVRMDSQYAMKAVTQWLPGWRRKGWKTAAGTPVANKDLIVAIDALLAERDVEFVYVPAHQVDGDPLNAFADRAASDTAVAQQPAGTSLGSAAPEPRAESAPPARRGSAGSSAGSSGQAPRARSGGRSGGASTGGRTKAKFPGACRCGRPYGVGDPIAKNPDGWGHPDCVKAAAPA
ncbi:ribonuclease H [Kitasatospora sp. NPDC058170]|uniref:ribonuclease H family protein n=1 Tax=Kitasatospora sp. NPDC058170 TaxID=3346364 RepID=UPI0036DEDE98